MPVWPERSVDRLPCFRTFRVGPVLAWSLAREGSSTAGREKVGEVLARAVPPGAAVLFCFGEIDCRFHILRQAERQGRPFAALAAECAEVYFDAARDLAGPGRTVLFCSVPPSTRLGEVLEGEYPRLGSCAVRNEVTRAFNRRLQALCGERGLAFVDYDGALVDGEGLSRACFFRDEVHLGQVAMGAFVAALRRAWPDFRWHPPLRYRMQVALSRLFGIKVR
ncbi:hypothetical protein [Verrucomicrobium sp. GAS474]|uniref:hypothetical protein n=1 Tax=Verrucomicrobium sp. GAS474 TaxID=1882831 RepID=UPI0012FFCF45|nr:hypothetical protein [Verrucomicrobium sp. GAS474]